MHALAVRVGLAVIFAMGCGKPATAPTAPEANSAEMALLAKRIDKMDRRLARIEKALGGDLRAEPDPEVTYSIPVVGDPFDGPADARVTIVKAFEFACGFCYRVRPTLEELVASYKGDVRVVYKYYVVHDQAVIPGLAACAASKQGKFHEMTELIWEKGFVAEDLGEEKMTELATELGLDLPAYTSEMRGEACMAWLKNGYQTLADMGVRGTPAFFINGRFLSGAQPIEAFRQIIDAELAKANKLIGASGSSASYYEQHVVEAGAKELEQD